MNYEIKGGSFPIVEITLNEGEKVISESGAMCWRDEHILMETSSGGGLKKVLGRMFTDDKLFQNIYTATENNSKISFASCIPGSIKAIELKDGQSIICQKNAFLLAIGDITMSVHFSKKIRTGLFGGEGFLMQKIEGNGTVFLEIDGSEFEYSLEENQKLVISTGHLVSVSKTCQIDIERIKGFKNIFFGGEGLFNTIITGPGKVVVQTMPLQKLANAIEPYLDFDNETIVNETSSNNNN